MKKLTQQIIDFNLADRLKRRLQQADRPFWLAFALAFVALNLLFIFHGAHYMFGDHDWKYLKNGIAPDAGLFEGRFSQFILINLLTSGEILPLINNAVGFAGFALGIALLARYWRLPHTRCAYALFALFTAITPYVLSFMYFAFLIMPVLSWNAVVIAALLISEKKDKFPLPRTLLAALMITLALGGYPPVINLIAVALSVRILSALLFDENLRAAIRSVARSIAACILGAALYKLCLLWLTHSGTINTSYYNLQTLPLSEWGDKFALVTKDIFRQLTVTLPFITAPYKIAALIMTAAGLLSAFVQTARRPKTTLPALIILIAVLYAPMLTLFISASLAETEFSPRIDFFGLMYFYAAMLALTLKTAAYPATAPLPRFLKNIAATAAILAIFFSANNISEAQKVWKLGFDGELKLYRRADARLRSSPDFNPDKKYVMVQGGAPSLRHRFYHTPYNHGSDDLLGTSYVPGLNPAVMWNYYSGQEYADPTSYVYTFQPDAAAQTALKFAAPWPAPQSAAVSPQTSSRGWMLLIFSQEGLNALRQRYSR